MIDSRVQSADFDASRQLDRLAELGCAAVLSFVGIVEAGPEVSEVTIDHYPAMAKTELARIADEAAARWTVAGIILIHRYGLVVPGEALLFAGVAVSDPMDAQEACAYLVAETRRRAPFWRREELADGGFRWREGGGA